MAQSEIVRLQVVNACVHYDVCLKHLKVYQQPSISSNQSAACASCCALCYHTSTEVFLCSLVPRSLPFKTYPDRTYPCSPIPLVQTSRPRPVFVVAGKLNLHASGWIPRCMAGQQVSKDTAVGFSFSRTPSVTAVLLL